MKNCSYPSMSSECRVVLQTRHARMDRYNTMQLLPESSQMTKRSKVQNLRDIQPAKRSLSIPWSLTVLGMAKDMNVAKTPLRKAEQAQHRLKIINKTFETTGTKASSKQRSKRDYKLKGLNIHVQTSQWFWIRFDWISPLTQETWRSLWGGQEGITSVISTNPDRNLHFSRLDLKGRGYKIGLLTWVSKISDFPCKYAASRLWNIQQALMIHLHWSQGYNEG